jgi:DNA-binding NarL/FixJ family response regulator
MTSEGGPHPGALIETRARAFVCVVRPKLGQRIHRALSDLGLEVVDTEDLDGLASLLTIADAAVAPSGGSTVLVLDDGSSRWLGAVARLVERWPRLRPLLIADLAGPEDFLSAISAGVSGFCPRDASEDAIARSVESMLETGVAIPRSLTGPLVESIRSGRGRRVQTAAGAIEVTEREWEILQMLVQRRSTREIADALFVSVGTVRSHVSTVLKKLGAVDRDDAISLIERGKR